MPACSLSMAISAVTTLTAYSRCTCATPFIRLAMMAKGDAQPTLNSGIDGILLP